VFLDDDEAEGIRAHLGLSRGWFRRHYLKRLPEGDVVASWQSDGRCVFLDARGECSIYPVRPLQCRTYPFWPEIVRRQRDWQRESRRCEGINRGAAMSVTRVRELLGRGLDRSGQVSRPGVQTRKTTGQLRSVRSGRDRG
jgi:Fe-S-cluster containining protein